MTAGLGIGWVPENGVHNVYDSAQSVWELNQMFMVVGVSRALFSNAWHEAPSVTMDVQTKTTP